MSTLRHPAGEASADADELLPAEQSEPDVALVTGANKGIGFHTARQLAQRGLTVLLGSRDVERGNHAAATRASEGLDVHVVRLDVSDDASVQAAAEQIALEHQRLDVLINNAGIAGGLARSSEVTRYDLSRTFETNVFGLASVTNFFLPLLRKSSHGRVVNVSSELGSPRLMNDPDAWYSSLNNAAYQASKSAVDMLTILYAKELAEAGITVSAVGPGYRATDLSGGVPTPGAGDPADGATAIVNAALNIDPSLNGVFIDKDGEVVPW